MYHAPGTIRSTITATTAGVAQGSRSARPVQQRGEDGGGGEVQALVYGVSQRRPGGVPGDGRAVPGDEDRQATAKEARQPEGAA